MLALPLLGEIALPASLFEAAAALDLDSNDDHTEQRRGPARTRPVVARHVGPSCCRRYADDGLAGLRRDVVGGAERELVHKLDRPARKDAAIVGEREQGALQGFASAALQVKV
jgi:hypothetical protein